MFVHAFFTNPGSRLPCNNLLRAIMTRITSHFSKKYPKLGKNVLELISTQINQSKGLALQFLKEFHKNGQLDVLNSTTKSLANKSVHYPHFSFTTLWTCSMLGSALTQTSFFAVPLTLKFTFRSGKTTYETVRNILKLDKNGNFDLKV